MSTYCFGDPLPTFPDLSNIGLKFGINFPGLPTLPSPIFPSINIPSLEAYIAGPEMLMAQLFNTVLGMIKPMLDLLSININDWLPPMPVIPSFNIMDIINGKIDDMIAELKKILATGINIKLPLMPDLYPTMEIPDIKVIQIMDYIMKNYIVLIAAKITDLISSVTSFLNIGMPTFPTLPTEDQIIQMMGSVIDSSIKSVNDFVEYVKNFKLDPIDLLAKLTFPGLPKMPKIPGFPTNLTIPDVTITFDLSNFMPNLVLGLLQEFMAFINSTLKSFMSFSFPTICI